MTKQKDNDDFSINLVANREFLEMDMSKLKEFMYLYFFLFRKILEDHMNKCENQGRFVEAEMAFQRIKQFEKIIEAKELIELKASHRDEVYYIF